MRRSYNPNLDGEFAPEERGRYFSELEAITGSSGLKWISIIIMTSALACAAYHSARALVKPAPYQNQR